MTEPKYLPCATEGCKNLVERKLTKKGIISGRKRVYCDECLHIRRVETSRLYYLKNKGNPPNAICPRCRAKHHVSYYTGKGIGWYYCSGCRTYVENLSDIAMNM